MMAERQTTSPEHAVGEIPPETSTEPSYSSVSETTLEGKREDNLELLLDIPLEISVELGRTKMLINDLLKLGQGAVIELPKEAGDTLEIFANKRLIAKGDVVEVNQKYGVRLTEVISPAERLENLK